MLKHGSVTDFEFDFVRRDGRAGTGLNSAEIIDLKGEPHVLSITIDITDRKKAEEALRQGSEELTALNLLGRSVGASLSVELVAAAALTQAAAAIKADWTLLYLRQGGEWVFHGGRAGAGSESLPGAAVLAVGELLGRRIAAEGGAVYVLELDGDPLGDVSAGDEVGLTSLAGLPLYGHQDMVGLLVLFSARRRDFSRQATFLETFSAEAAIGLQNARLYEEVSRYSSQLENRLAELNAAQAELKSRKRTLPGSDRGVAAGGLHNIARRPVSVHQSQVHRDIRIPSARHPPRPRLVSTGLPRCGMA